jgi:hypothetical protein
MNPRRRLALGLVCLESRLAPAVTVATATTATYTDIDGDKVTVKVSAGTLTAGLFTTAAQGLGDQLQTVDLSGGGFDGVSVTVSVLKVATGDGLANVGYINSTLHDLGAVAVKGDLGRIDAGDAVTGTPGLKSLTVRSLGRYGTDTQAGGDLQSDITGALGALVVAGDVKEAFVTVTGGADGKLGAVSIGGSVIGGSNFNTGIISSSGDMGPVKIGRDLLGGRAGFSGQIGSNGKIASVSIGGSLVGGLGFGGGFSGQISCVGDLGPVKIAHDVLGGGNSVTGRIRTGSKLASVSIGGSLIGGQGDESGRIFSGGDMGPVKIGHDVQGLGPRSGYIQSLGKLASVSIGGSLIGGSAPLSGAIDSAGDLGLVKVGHDVTGGNVTSSNSLDGSGMIVSSGRIAGVSIGGSMISGTDTSTGVLTRNATIRAGNDIGTLTVKGGLIGNVTTDGVSPVIISARGREFPTAGVDLAIGKITIGGSVEYASILAGYKNDLTPDNADAQVGAVSVGGDWIASSLAAGVTDGGDGFGNGNDVVIAGGSGSTVSRIGGVAIKGLVYGTPTAAGVDHFGFVAQQVGSFKCLGFTATLAAGTDAPIELALTTGDVTIREV